MIRIRTLNLRHGGGKRSEALADYLESVDADILVLSEFRQNASGRLIQDRLEDHGFKVETSNPPARKNGVAVAAKKHLPFRVLPHPTSGC